MFTELDSIIYVQNNRSPAIYKIDLSGFILSSSFYIRSSSSTFTLSCCLLLGSGPEGDDVLYRTEG